MLKIGAYILTLTVFVLLEATSAIEHQNDFWFLNWFLKTRNVMIFWNRYVKFINSVFPIMYIATIKYGEFCSTTPENAVDV